MIVVHDVAALREVVRGRRRIDNDKVALVPTMGNLHAGHLALVRAAGELAATTIVSVYVNPLQFGPNEDLESYPRTLKDDLAELTKLSTDVVFVPDDATMYPRGLAEQTKVEVPNLSSILCGEYRPGHFAGVATVVNRLFNLVQPDVAVFGKKDYQQLTIVRRMVSDLGMPLEVVGVDTVREPDGLALSSRNRYLTKAQRSGAPVLYRTLCEIKQNLETSQISTATAESDGYRKLVDAGFSPDYFSVRTRDELATPGTGEHLLVILAAAYLGDARLIDNVEVELGQSAMRVRQD